MYLIFEKKKRENVDDTYPMSPPETQMVGCIIHIPFPHFEKGFHGS